MSIGRLFWRNRTEGRTALLVRTLTVLVFGQAPGVGVASTRASAAGGPPEPPRQTPRGLDAVDPLEFLARVLVRMRDNRHVTTAFRGWYANRLRRMRRQAERAHRGPPLMGGAPAADLRGRSSRVPHAAPPRPRLPHECPLLNVPRHRGDLWRGRQTRRVGRSVPIGIAPARPPGRTAPQGARSRQPARGGPPSYRPLGWVGHSLMDAYIIIFTYTDGWIRCAPMPRVPEVFAKA